MEKRLARELIKSRKAVKEKYQSLKTDSTSKQSELEQTYRPITQPLKQLISTIAKTETDFDFKDEPLSPKAYSTPQKTDTLYTALTPKKTKRTRTGKTPALPTEMPSFFDRSMGSVSLVPSIQETSVIAETTPQSDRDTTNDDTVENLNLSDVLEQTRGAIQQYVNTPSYKDWLGAFHKLPRTYIDDGVRDTKHKFDHNYGVVHDYENDKFLLGLTGKPVEIIDKDVKVENILYSGTTGLYELLFKKEPVGYKKEDLDNYMDILKRTNIYRRNNDPNEQVQGNSSHKYVTIIGPYLQREGITKHRTLKQPLQRLVDAFGKPKAPYRETRQRELNKTGKGIKLKVYKPDTDYVYWDNSNELVDRLRLLIASKNAGNNGHNNEIISIIEELKEAKIIL